MKRNSKSLVSGLFIIVLGYFTGIYGLGETHAFQTEAVPESGQIISTITPDQLVQTLQGLGWTAQVLESNEEGREHLQVTVNEYLGYVTLLNCLPGGNGPECKNFVFFSNFKLGRDYIVMDLLKLNSYNDSFINGRGYLLDKPESGQDEIGVDLYISLEGGVTRDYLLAQVRSFEIILAEFVSNFRGEEE